MANGFLSTLTGSFSSPADDNPTVAMMEAAYAAAGLNARHVNVEVKSADLADAVTGARAMGWVGFTCSAPHHVAVIDHVDQLAESAELIGAVSCVVVNNGSLTGHNTDGRGFVEAMREFRHPGGTHVVVLGAGGVGRAIAVETALAGAARITVVNRDIGQGEALAALVADRTGVDADFQPWTTTYAVPDSADVVVNSTPVGWGDDGALHGIDVDSLRRELLVADVSPTRQRTAYLREADLRGAETLDGIGMLVAQGAVAIELWHGLSPDRDLMRTRLSEALGAETVI
ncbi:shikimate dehydrogenase [Knoellia sinensis KCTC 19936]|uniref:shikimate dehydrogenase (NADP(+)) n=1 Tax=Knoellia sinensis KCTC 19936 TaxID=1385520 RepID=A0A0A0J8Z5_9MICO|nr:shikimate dehydrogenase [Knoellia sinensis]KGN32066.1 shikimate dehydrogenase [Knoellia sinensis KCTC 19936]